MMKLKTRMPENMVANLPTETVLTIADFLDLCAELDAIIQRENQLILATGTSVTDGEFHYKLQLMGSFEQRSATVFSVIAKDAPENKWLQLYVVSEVAKLRQSFKINTALHMDDLQRRARKLMRLRDGLLATTLKADNDAEAEALPCH